MQGNGADSDDHTPLDYVKATRGAAAASGGKGGDATINNHLSTPLAIVAVLAFFVSGLIGGLALATANEANSFGHQAEREARVAQDQINSLNNNLRAEVSALSVRIQVAEALVQAYGLQKQQEQR